MVLEATMGRDVVLYLFDAPHPIQFKSDWNDTPEVDDTPDEDDDEQEPGKGFIENTHSTVVESTNPSSSSSSSSFCTSSSSSHPPSPPPPPSPLPRHPPILLLLPLLLVVRVSVWAFAMKASRASISLSFTTSLLPGESTGLAYMEVALTSFHFDTVGAGWHSLSRDEKYAMFEDVMFQALGRRAGGVLRTTTRPTLNLGY